MPLPSNSFPLRDGGVIPKVHRVSMIDRCRRLNACLAMSPRTSSYPDSWRAGQRPWCHTCVTAATGGSAPSNARVGLHHTSSSCGQEPPGRKFTHALFSGMGQNQIRVKGYCGDPAEVFHGAAAGAPAPQVNGQLAGQGDHGLLLHGGARAQPGFHFGRRLPVGLPLQEAPHGFDQQGPHAPVAHPVNAAHAPLVGRVDGEGDGVPLHSVGDGDWLLVNYGFIEKHATPPAQLL